jgi:cytochrome oxidase Cu insertion factor (SCO1/SenC/PrrC family)
VGYVNHPSRFRLYPWTVDAVRAINRAGWLAVVVTNQAGVARGYFTDTQLVTADGRKVRFYSDVLKDRVVLISFIYTTCTDACPMITHNLTVAKKDLGEQFGRDVRFVSLSIDPERDTPAEMGKFATKLNAKDPEWYFLTGGKADMDRILKKLGAFTEDPKDHFTGIFIGNLRTDRWRKVRPDTPPAVIATELRSLVADSGAAAPAK